jgi:16S rRNA (uracil1498-N3)-methyltransferase
MVLGSQVVLTGDPLRHARAQRLSPGEPFRVVLGDTVYQVKVEEVLSGRLIGSITGRRRVNPPKARVHLYASLLKSQGFNLVVEKATELGAASVTPVVTARTIPHPDPGKAAERRARWQKVARAASEQCGRGFVPEIRDVMTFSEVMEQASGRRLLAYEHEGLTVDLEEVLSGATEASILIGPEGGIDASEVEEALKKGFVPVSLGPYILKAETASLAAVAILMHYLSKQA